MTVVEGDDPIIMIGCLDDELLLSRRTGRPSTPYSIIHEHSSSRAAMFGALAISFLALNRPRA